VAHYLNLVRVPAMVLRAGLGGLPRLAPLETDSVACHVLPWDLDYNLHLNNSRYLAYMDYGRIRLLARLGLLRRFFRRGNSARVGSVDITYRRSLNFAARFTLDSRIACWDEKWIYMEQTFTGAQGLAAHAWVKTLFRNRQGNVAPQELVDSLAPGTQSPPLPPRLLQWNAAIRETLHAVDGSHAR
jgi:acyl-CoA thioesterase FadM